MTTATRKALMNAEIVAAEGQVPEWVMVLRTGQWLGHPTAPEIVTPEHLASALAYFARHYAAHGADLVVDYHHASAVVPLGTGKAPAAGWISAMELRADGTELWGRVGWTAEAANAITEREFRYLSPVLRFDRPDRVTARPVPLQIPSVALTNTPFLTELESLNANAGATDGAGTDAPSQGGTDMSLIDSLAEALGKTPEQVTSELGLEGEVDNAKLAATLMAAAARVTELEAAATAAADAAEQAKQTEASEPELSAEVANALGLDAGSAIRAIKAEILKLQANAGLTSVRMALGLDEKAGQEAVLNAIGGLQASHRQSEAEELVDEGVKTGRLPPAQRAFWLNAAQGDLDATRDAINSLPVVTGASALAGRKAGASGDGELTDEQKAMCKRLGVSEEKFKLGLAG